MKISKKSRYGLRAMIELSLSYEKGPLSASHVSARQGIPVLYLEQIFNCLKKKGLVKTQRGPKGGYVLSSAPSNISVHEILSALGERDFIVECLSKKKSICSRADACHARLFWSKFDNQVKDVLSSTTLKDICLDRPANYEPNGIEHSYAFQI